MFGSIVRTTAGRDKGLIFLVASVEGDYVYLIDGDLRKVENPKKKKLKHIVLTDYYDKSIADRVIKHNKITNQDVKKVLKKFQVDM